MQIQVYFTNLKGNNLRTEKKEVYELDVRL